MLANLYQMVLSIRGKTEATKAASTEHVMEYDFSSLNVSV
jgi:hypothetical protein